MSHSNYSCYCLTVRHIWHVLAHSLNIYHFTSCFKQELWGLLISPFYDVTYKNHLCNELLLRKITIFCVSFVQNSGYIWQKKLFPREFSVNRQYWAEFKSVQYSIKPRMWADRKVYNISYCEFHVLYANNTNCTISIHLDTFTNFNRLSRFTPMILVHSHPTTINLSFVIKSDIMRR
jgi:hypothetical protein